MPAVAIGAKLADATKHPQYAAAKAGDQVAALELARDLVTDEFVREVRGLLGDAQAIIVPVNAQEAAGRNKIPLAVANVLAQRLGLSVGNNVIQVNRPQRTDMDGLDRLFAVPEFDGAVQPDASYLLVDDTLTQGRDVRRFGEPHCTEWRKSHWRRCNDRQALQRHNVAVTRASWAGP